MVQQFIAQTKKMAADIFETPIPTEFSGEAEKRDARSRGQGVASLSSVEYWQNDTHIPGLTAEMLSECGIQVTRVKAAHRRTYATAPYESTIYEHEMYATVEEGADPIKAGGMLLATVRAVVSLSAMHELERTGRMLPRVVKAAAGAKRSATDLDPVDNPSGIEPELHLYAEAITESVREKVEAEAAKSAF